MLWNFNQGSVASDKVGPRPRGWSRAASGLLSSYQHRGFTSPYTRTFDVVMNMDSLDSISPL